MKKILGLIILISFSQFSWAAVKTLPTYDNSYFYDDNGTFLQEKAKDAIISLMEYHGYPTFPGIRDKMFVADYNAGRFADVGISGIMFENSQTNMYMLLDFFLLPNQMVAEHYHTDGETSAAKREGWLVRWGDAYIGGIGEDNLQQFKNLTIPQVHLNGTVQVKNVTLAKPGSFTNMKQVLTNHWMMAGENGAIITEVANYSDSKTSIRIDPKMK